MSNRNKGIIFILLAAVCFSSMSALVRLSGDLPTMQKALFRNFFAMVVAFILLKRKGIAFDVNRGNIRDLVLRSFFGTLGIFCNFFAVDKLAISDANMLNKLSPFFAILMSILILKENVKLLEWISVLLAFLGALLVIKPGFSLSSIYAFVGAFGGFSAGVAYTMVRKLGTKGVKGPVIVLFFSLFSTLVTLPFFILQYQPMSILQILLLISAGIMAAGGQLSITAAYTYAPASEISIYDYSQVIFAAVFGFFLFDQIPDVYSVIGYFVILGAALLRFFYQKK